jgi:hypothetical protein
MKLNVEQSSQNENRISNEHECEILDDLMEERTSEPFQKPYENHDSLQTKLRVNFKERK